MCFLDANGGVYGSPAPYIHREPSVTGALYLASSVHEPKYGHRFRESITKLIAIPIDVLHTLEALPRKTLGHAEPDGEPDVFIE